jgi:hypothetical protein
MSAPLSIEDQALAQRLADGGLWPLLQRGWYERGTFTPAIQGTGTAGTFTYIAQRGDYVRLGDVVWISLQCAISAITVAPTGNMRISGLPFTPMTTNATPYTMAMWVSQIDYPAGALELVTRIDDSAAVINLWYTRDNNTSVQFPAASFTNANANIIISGHYFL